MFLSSVTIYIKGIECFGVHIYFILVIILINYYFILMVIFVNHPLNFIIFLLKKMKKTIRDKEYLFFLLLDIKKI